MKLDNTPFRGDNDYYHYVYQTTNLINGKKYIGKHSSPKYPNKYIGCGVKSQRTAEIMKEQGYSGFPCAVVKHGYNSFSKEVLAFFKSSEEAYHYESILVGEEVVKSNLYYNIISGGGKAMISSDNNKFKGTEKFIKESTEIHSGRYDYSLSEYKGANSFIKIICPKHGVFQQKAVSHIKGHGCKKCTGLDKKDTDYFIKKGREIHGNLYDYSLSKYKNSTTKVKIICKKHGVFEQRPYDHYRGRTCPKCTVHKKISTKEYIEKCKKVHGLKYDYSLVKYGGSGKTIKIICSEHGVFEQKASLHLRGSGCFSCYGSEKLTNEVFIERAKEVHGDRFDYSLIDYKNNKTKVKIVCKEHGPFLQNPGNHLNGFGCSRCSGNDKKDTKYIIEEAKNIYRDRYDYSQIEYINSKTKIKVGCKKHGIFEQTPPEFLKGRGCPRCSPTGKRTTEDFIEKSKETHGDTYDYSISKYVNTKTKIKIKCKKHGAFEQFPSDHIRGSGCRECAFEKNRTNP